MVPGRVSVPLSANDLCRNALKLLNRSNPNSELTPKAEALCAKTEKLEFEQKKLDAELTIP